MGLMLALATTLSLAAQQPPASEAVVFRPADIGEGLFYAMPGDAAVASFTAHADAIGVIAPQSFALDRHGLLRGSVPSGLMAVAQRNAVPLMPLVINAGFSRTNAIRLLHNASARDRAVGALVDTARSLNLAGWQLDFENLPSTQRRAFSEFVAEVAGALHRHGKLLSVAVAARTSEEHGKGFRTFSGVYDYAALGASADFLSVMAYPEYTDTPGPLASVPWVEQVLNYVLREVPPSKVSLGLPTYQTDWWQRRYRRSVRERVEGKVHRVFHIVYRLVHRSGPVVEGPLEWDPVAQSSYRIVGTGHHRKVTWVEDERSFAAKLKLVGQYHLRGFSVWRIGLEDPQLWTRLPPAPRRAVATLAPGATPALITAHN